MATAFPKSTILGIDSHAPSIERARILAGERGLANARFSTHPVERLSKADDATGAKVRDGGFDLVVHAAEYRLTPARTSASPLVRAAMFRRRRCGNSLLDRGAENAD